MKSSNELQKFILSIRPELKDFISLTKSNNINIKKVFSEMYQKYSELNTKKIKLVSLTNNFADIKCDPDNNTKNIERKSIKGKSIKVKKIKKAKKSKKQRKSKQQRKSRQQKYIKLEGYFNNLDACSKFYNRDTYKSNYLTIIELLYTKYNYILQIIFREHYYTPEQIEKVNKFLENMNNMSLDEKIEWANFDGVMLARSIYTLFLNNQLSQEIVSLIGDTPELYGQFTSLDVQQDIELNIPYRYHFNYKLMTQNPINLLLTIHSHKNNYKMTKKFLYRIFFINYLTNKSQIDLKIWLSSRRKLLPIKENFNSTRYLGAKEINSGFTLLLLEAYPTKYHYGDKKKLKIYCFVTRINTFC